MKKGASSYAWPVVSAIAAVIGSLLLAVLPAGGQEEVASAIRSYKEREASTGYYEQYEMRPRRQQPLMEIPGVQRGRFVYSPTAAQTRIRTRLADSHQNINFYSIQRCETCHPDQARDNHTLRANITCRQCHGGEPIASINHYYSLMNPIRKHAYVCAKCHQGASASFAAYIVHEPAPGSTIARFKFPALYYAYWFMLVLLVGTLSVFIPHSVLVGLRELFVKKRKDAHDADIAH
jgi:hypothetical protein